MAGCKPNFYFYSYKYVLYINIVNIRFVKKTCFGILPNMSRQYIMLLIRGRMTCRNYEEDLEKYLFAEMF